LDVNGLNITVPADKITGPVYTSTEPPKISDALSKSTGTLPLDVTENTKPEVEMGQYDKNGGLDNYFMSNFDLINLGNEVLAITKVSAQYETADGQWVNMTSPVELGRRSGFYNYSWGKENRFNLNPLGQMQLAICCGIAIKGPVFDRERRSHQSLPQPLKIKFTFEDAQKRTCSIIVEHVNTPRQLVTRESTEKGYRKAEYWIQCDDTDLEARLFAGAFLDDKQERVELRCCSGNTVYLYRKTFKKYVYKAVQGNQSEVPVDGLAYKNAGCIGNVSVLIDLQHKKAVAVKFHLQTTTGNAIGYYKIPTLK